MKKFEIRCSECGAILEFKSYYSTEILNGIKFVIKPCKNCSQRWRKEMEKADIEKRMADADVFDLEITNE